MYGLYLSYLYFYCLALIEGFHDQSKQFQYSLIQHSLLTFNPLPIASLSSVIIHFIDAFTGILTLILCPLILVSYHLFKVILIHTYHTSRPPQSTMLHPLNNSQNIIMFL